MPIFEQTYRKWDGTLRTTGIRWFPITKMGIKQTFKKKRFLLFFIACQIPFLVFAIRLIIAALVPENIENTVEFLKVNPSFFAHFLWIQSTFIFIMTIWSGANLINGDYQSNALQLYLSKPLTQLDYILGKLSIVAFFNLAITMVPAILLFILRVLIKYDKSWFVQNLWVIPAIIGISLTMSVIHSLFILCLSAITTNSRFSAITYFIILIFTDGIADLLYHLRRVGALLSISINNNILSLFSIFFGKHITEIPEYSENAGDPYYGAAILIFLCVCCYFVIKKRVGRIEVIQ
jgi:ABC-type transport system involved in multi-copper enzyme maturation permease subunit